MHRHHHKPSQTPIFVPNSSLAPIMAPIMAPILRPLLRPLLLLPFLLFLTLPSSTQAALRVSPDGTGPYPTIQAALNAAADGDTIILADGVFTGSGNRDLEFFSEVVLRSQDGYDNCIIDCQGSDAAPHRAFYLTEETGGTVLDITVKSGWAVQGGAIYTGWGYYIFEDCLFMDNVADQTGGVFHGGEGAVINFRGCIFSHNSAGTAGGAIYGTGSSGLAIQQSTFVRNGAPSGGSLYLADDASAQVENSIMAFGLQGSAFAGYYFGEVEFNCCNLYANRGGDWVNGATGDHNLNVDPRLADPMAQPLPDVDLTADSPCRAGNNACGVTMGAGRETYSHAPAYGIKADGSGLFPTLYEASHWIGHGGVIVLEDSLYTGSGAANIMVTGVSMVSRQDDPATCTIDISDVTAARFFHTDYIDGTFSVSGITFTGGDLGSGALVRVDGNSSLTLENCVFTGNETFGTGHLFEANVHTQLIIDGCEFSSNTQLPGNEEPMFDIYGNTAGHIVFQECTFSGNQSPAPLMRGATLRAELILCTLSQNSALTLFQGGVNNLTLTETDLVGNTLADADVSTTAALLQMSDAEVIMSYCDVLDNTSTEAMVNIQSCYVAVHGCLLRGNRAGSYPGGAMRLSYTTGTLGNCRFEANEAAQNAGGALSVTASGSAGFTGTLDIESCTFVSNHSHNDGTAIYAGATGFYYDDMDYGSQTLTVNLTGCTLHRNSTGTAHYERGQIAYSSIVPDGFTETGALHLNVSRCLITDGIGCQGFRGQLSYGSTSIECSDIHGNEQGDWVEDWLQIAQLMPGNFSDDPLYCGADAGNLTLQTLSPALAANNACNLQIGAAGHGCEGVSAVEDGPVSALRTGITAAYPNPFNPRTTISFDLAADGPVTACVYDLKGRLVRTLAHSRPMAAGYHELVWDGRDDHQASAAAGVYLVRLQAGDTVSQTKVMMLK